MTTETFFQLHYHLTDTEGLFDLAQGIAVQRRRLKKHDARCRSFRWFSRRLLWQGAVLLALGAVLLWLTASLALGRASGALTGLCFGCGVLELVLCALMRRNYRRGWRLFLLIMPGRFCYNGENRQGRRVHGGIRGISGADGGG